MLSNLKKEVLKANLELPMRGLATHTWGNVSGIDRAASLVAIKPGGLDYDVMEEDDIVIVDFEGNTVEGEWKPSSDAMTHIVLYNAFPEIGGICHCHSRWVTSWAQSGLGIPAYGTTHADYFYGTIPCTRDLRFEEIEADYEKNIGLVIKETFMLLDQKQIPAVLVKNHGAFTWGKDAEDAVNNMIVLEEVAMMALQAKLLNPHIKPMSQLLLDKHFVRIHGANAYYGQKQKK
jgi:L-ribulose-5-phosphate 4-epimerase